MSRIRILVLFLFFSLVAGGCAHETGTSKPGEAINLNPEEALARLDLRSQDRRLLKAIAEIAVITETGRYPLKLAILAWRPDSLRLEAIPVIGLPNFFLAAHAGRLAVYLPGTGEYYTGAAVPENLARFFPLSLSISDLISLLTGGRPALPMEEQPRVEEGFHEGAAYRLDISSRDRRFRQSLWIDGKTGYLRRCKQTAGNCGDDALNVYFDAYVPVDGVPMPQRIRVKMKGEEERTVVLEYESVTLETMTAAGAELFGLPVPPGAKVRRLE